MSADARVLTMQPLLLRVRRTLCRAQGAAALRHLRRALPGPVDRAGLDAALRSLEVQLTAQEVWQLFVALNSRRQARIDPQLVVEGIRGGALAEPRLSAVQAVFSSIAEGGAHVSPAVLIESFQPAGHPDVAAGRSTAEEAHASFAAEWESCFTVSEQDLVEWYADTGCGVDSDDAFLVLLRDAWPWAALPSPTGQARRVLVVHTSGKKTVELIPETSCLREDDAVGMVAFLRARGVPALSVYVVK